MYKTIEFISTKLETQCNKCQKIKHLIILVIRLPSVNFVQMHIKNTVTNVMCIKQIKYIRITM